MGPERDILLPGGDGPVGTFRPGAAPVAFEPEYAGLEGQYFVQAKLQARRPDGGVAP